MNRRLPEPAAGPATGPADRALFGTRHVATVALATFFFWVSLYLYVPVLPLHARELGANLQMIGYVVASYAIGQLLLRIPIGIGSDVWGRKPFAIGALVLSGAGAAWLGVAPDPWSLFAARALTGVAAAGWVAMSVLYSSYYPPARTARSMAIIMSVNSLSLVTATFLGGLLADHLGNVSTFYGAAGVAFAGALLLSTAEEPPGARRERHSWGSLASALRSPLLLQVSAIAITLQFVTFAVNFGFLPVHAENLGASKAEVGYITTAGLAAALLGAATSIQISTRVGSARAVTLASAATAASLVLMVGATDLVVLGALQVLSGFGRGLLNTVLISLALQSASPGLQATAMGSYQALYAIGMLAGPAVSGRIANSFGVEAVFWTAAAATGIGVLLVGVRRLPR